MHRFRLVALFVTLSALFASFSDAEARCRHPRIGWQFGKSTTTLWSTDEDSVCTSRSLYPDTIERIEILSKARHGMAGTSGPYSVAYKPDHNYRGSDTFSYSVISNSNARKGAGQVARVTVFVEVR